MILEAEERPDRCFNCGGPTRVRKTWVRTGITLEHGTFRLRQKVRVCVAGCPGSRRAGALAGLVPPRGIVGYDVMVYVGLQRCLHHRQREEIRVSLAADFGIFLSSGEISMLARRFLAYLERLHQASAPRLRAALAADGGWPLHMDATGEDGRGTLLVAFAGWRQWVLGAWRIPTERADAILPRLREVTFRFGPPCAIVRDLGRAMAEAADRLVEELQRSIPVLACHLHFLADVGKDLLEASHDRLRGLFRQTKLRSQLRALARSLGRRLGRDIDSARAGLLAWQAEAADPNPQLPEGSLGIATVRALAQWILDYPADTHGDGFPFDLPWLTLYDRCLQAAAAIEHFLADPPRDREVRRSLERLRRILRPIQDDALAFGAVAGTLSRRAGIFAELRKALRLRPESPRRNTKSSELDHTMRELQDIRLAVRRLIRSLRRRRPQRGPARDHRQAIDIVLSHLQTHGRYLWGHAIRLSGKRKGVVRLVERTNNLIESLFHVIKHGERRRSGRKVLTNDFERLHPAAALATNLTRLDYVSIVCGSLDRLHEAFAKLDRKAGLRPKPSVSALPQRDDAESASLSSADRKIVRGDGMTRRFIQAAQKASRARRAA